MKTTIELPLLPLRDVVVYPHMVIPLFVGREKSIEALESAMSGDKQILLLAQKNPADDDPGEDALYRVGTVATVLQLLKLPDGTVKVLVEGEQRGVIERFVEVDDHCRAEVSLIEEADVDARESEVFTRSLLSQFEQYVQLGKKVPAEVLSSLSSIDEPARLDEPAQRIVGDGPERERLLTQAAASGHAGRIRLLGDMHERLEA